MALPKEDVDGPFVIKCANQSCKGGELFFMPFTSRSRSHGRRRRSEIVQLKLSSQNCSLELKDTETTDKKSENYVFLVIKNGKISLKISV